METAFALLQHPEACCLFRIDGIKGSLLRLEPARDYGQPGYNESDRICRSDGTSDETMTGKSRASGIGLPPNKPA